MKYFLFSVLLVSLSQLAGCAYSPSPENEYEKVSYDSSLSKTLAKRMYVGEFTGVGITALHTYFPIGSQIDVSNPVTKQRVSAKVVGRSPENQKYALLLSADAANALSLGWYPNTQMLVRVSRKTNVSTWPGRTQKKIVTYMPTKDSIKGVYQSIPEVKSRKNSVDSF